MMLTIIQLTWSMMLISTHLVYDVDINSPGL